METNGVTLGSRFVKWVMLVVQCVVFFDALVICYMWLTGVPNEEAFFIGLIIFTAALLFFLVVGKGIMRQARLAAIFYGLILLELALFVYGYFHPVFAGCDTIGVGLLHPWGILLSTNAPVCQIMLSIYPFCLVAIDAFIVTVVGGIAILFARRCKR